MSLFPFFQWLQSLGYSTALRESSLMYPLVMTTHLASIALFGGMILMGDLRLLGVAMKDRPVADVIGGLRMWKRIGFVIMVTMGFLLLSAKAEQYYPNPYYWLKMTFLALVFVHWLVFRNSVYGNLEAIDRAPRIPGVAKAAASISLVLWIGLVCAGRWIAYYEPAKDAVQAAIGK
jgi:hypothetical protein